MGGLLLVELGWLAAVHTVGISTLKHKSGLESNPLVSTLQLC